MRTLPVISIAMLTLATTAHATESNDELQDMSDPMAIYTQAGFGFTDKGLNLKVGQTYDTGSDSSMAMNIIELKGIAGDSLGFRDNDQALFSGVDDSIDSFRLRNFKVDLLNGVGSQLDVMYNVDKESADISYSLMQAVPALGRLQLYPLAGVGASLQNESDDGLTFPGAFGLVGMYSKFDVTDKIWLNYNPMWMTTLIGSDQYKDRYFGQQSNIFAHEFAASYKINPRTSVRYFANWSDKVNFSDGDHRIEFNYQF